MTPNYIDAIPSDESHFDPGRYREVAPNPEAKSDDELIAAMKSGEEGAFAELVERHQRFCMSKAYSILRNHGDAEDEVQNAWVQVWTHLDSYKGQGSFGAWLNRIVSNQCLMRLRKAKLAPMTSVDQVFESKGTFRLEIIDQRALPEQIVGDDQVLHLLKKEIQRVPFLLREILVMRDVGQRVMQDVSADLGITVPAAKSRLMRARIELKQRMEKHYGERNRCSSLLRKTRGQRVAYARAN
jgi:RNA polymerase sigma-70 factor (ECF subfamily)